MEKSKKDEPEQALGAEPESEKGKEQETEQPSPTPAATESTGAEEKPKEQKEGEPPPPINQQTTVAMMESRKVEKRTPLWKSLQKSRPSPKRKENPKPPG